MRIRLGVFLLTVALAAASAAGSYRFSLYQPSSLNGTEFKAGECKLELEGDKAVVRQGKTSAESPVRVENGDRKFSSTSVDTSDGRIHEIRLGGTTTKVVFLDAESKSQAAR
jgi:hypothetical protein